MAEFVQSKLLRQPHAAPLHGLPASRLVVQPQRALHGLHQGARIIVRKHETRAAAGVRGIDHCVGQAPSAPHNGDRAIALGDHLRQTARLVARGDQQQVGAGINLARQRRVEPQFHPHLVRKISGQVFETGFNCFQPGAQNHHLERVWPASSARRAGSARSKPFCVSRRETMPTSGTRG